MAYNPNNPNGQAVMADSAPVVIASNQSAVPVSVASLPLPIGTSGTPSTSVFTVQGIGGMTPVNITLSTAIPTGFNSIGKVRLQDGAANDIGSYTGGGGYTSLNVVLRDGTGAAVTDLLRVAGQKTMAGSASVVIASDQTNVPVTINPTGQALMAASIPVVIASNQSTVPISGTVTISGAGLATAAKQPQPTPMGTNPTEAIGVQGAPTMIPLKVDGSAVVQGVSIVSSVAGALTGSGLATVAKQPALGTTGASSTDVITVQGIAGMTPLDVTLSGSFPSSVSVVPQGGPTDQRWKFGSYATAQTGTIIWTPPPGSYIGVTHISISMLGAPGRVVLWFGDPVGSTTYVEGTDQPLYDVDSPSYPMPMLNPIYCAYPNVDYVLRVTTYAAVPFKVILYGFEFV